MTPTTPRRPIAADVPALAEVERRSAPAPWSAASLATTLAAPSTRGFVLGDPPVGHVLYSAVAGEGEILTLAVLPERRGRGFGRALLVAALDDWRATGIAEGWLEVRDDNAPAIRLYESTGWVRAGQRAAYYADGHDARVYRWSA